MRKFFTINIEKLKLAGKVTFTMFYLLLFALYFLPSDDKPEWMYLILFHLGFTLFLTFVIVVLIFINGYFAWWHQKILFRTKSLSVLFTKYKFEGDVINADNPWVLTKELKYGFVESYPVIIFRNPTKLRHIIIVVGINWGEDEEMKYRELDRAFNNHNAAIGFAAVHTSISIADNLEEAIKSLVNLRKRKGRMPDVKRRYA
jgi:uncharacterized membrane protein YqiK